MNLDENVCVCLHFLKTLGLIFLLRLLINIITTTTVTVTIAATSIYEASSFF